MIELELDREAAHEDARWTERMLAALHGEDLDAAEVVALLTGEEP